MRDHLVAYAERHGLDVALQAEVTAVRRGETGWEVETTDEPARTIRI